MIKVPATPEGVPAIRTLLSEGINVNVTLLFARKAYEAVAWAFIEGLEARAAKGQSVAGIASVASFFVSRIDSAVDAQLENLLKTASRADKVTPLGPPGQGGHRERQARLPELQEDLLGPALGAP